MKHFARLLMAFFLVMCLSSGTHVTTVFIVGDSTAAEKSHPESNPERGWGMVLQGFFDDHVVVSNHAVNGRSSKSFMNEGRWQRVLDAIKPGDYVVIQFGHNDEKPKPDRHTDPGSTFDAYLERYVNDTRARGGIPILMSCVVRRNFYNQPDTTTDDESLRNTSYTDEPVNSDTLVDTHGAYKDVPGRVARKKHVAFVDANRITHDLEQGLGVEGSRKLHMWYRPGEVPSIPKGRHDNTHYNVYGAHVVAGLLADAIGKAVPQLGRHVVHYDYVVSAAGRGNYLSLDKAVQAAGTHAKVYVVNGHWKVKKAVLKAKHVKLVVREGASINYI